MVQQWLLLWTKSMPSKKQVQTPTSPTRPAPKPSYSQVATTYLPEPVLKPGYQPATKENLWAHDPGKPTHDLAHDLTCDRYALKQPHDLTAHDCGNLSYDLPRDWSSIQSPDCMHFRCVPCPLINMWKTMGMINGWESIKSQDLLQSCSIDHSLSIISSCSILSSKSTYLLYYYLL